MRRVCLGLFALCEIHLANVFAWTASAWLNHWAIRFFPHLEGCLILGSGYKCLRGGLQ